LQRLLTQSLVQAAVHSPQPFLVEHELSPPSVRPATAPPDSPEARAPPAC
jgi:hypothetical protein